MTSGNLTDGDIFLKRSPQGTPQSFKMTMKKHSFFTSVLVILGLTIVPVPGQAQTGSYIETSNIVGKDVKTGQGEEIGQIKDIVLDTNGCVAYTVVATGGAGAHVAGGGKTVVVPWTVYSISPGASVYTVRVDKEKIYSAPVFESSRIQEYSNPQWVDQVYSHYGVSASAGFGGGAAQRSSAATGPTSTAVRSPGGTPVQAESPLATSTPAETASPSATGTPEASASPSRRHRADREESPSGREKTSVTPSPGYHREMTPGERNEGATSEESASPAAGRQTSSRHREGKEQRTPAEPGTTPRSTEQPQE
jgi:sporulation protein YlmC with PRC-barrel domain